MAEAHNHHFVPQGYLRGFADGIGRKARVFTVDLAEGKSFTTLVRNIAASRDFNKVEVEGLDPNAIEQAYGVVEGNVVEAIKRVEVSQSFDDADDRAHVLGLIALLTIRNPRQRDNIGRSLGDIAKSMAEMMVSTRERWDSIGAELEGSNPGLSRVDLPYEEVRDFVRSGEYEIKTHQNLHVQLELDMVQHIQEILGARKWQLWVSEKDAGDFVTSDHPVCLLSTSKGPQGPFGPGFGMVETAVLFPLTRKLTLVGTFEGKDKVVSANREMIARVNVDIIRRAQRQVYSFDNQFSYATPEGILKGERLAGEALLRRTAGGKGQTVPSRKAGAREKRRDA
jgi:hypothetical protein